MPRLSFKPDASFFRKIVIGAVGARAVISDLNSNGHQFTELERGSTETKLWKDIKRKRVRIPDLICSRCGKRVECRAKTDLELAMSHSPTDAERSWDYGMVDGDWIAFPVCIAAEEADWSVGALDRGTSYWRQKCWVQWQSGGITNYFTVAAFRSALHARSRTKGVEEGSENVIAWDATFSSREGIAKKIVPMDGGGHKVTIRRDSDGHRYTWPIASGKQVVITLGERVGVNQVIGSTVHPLSRSQLHCSGSLQAGHIAALLSSRERTQRYTGVKLARLRNEIAYRDAAMAFVRDGEEDVYIRLEAASFLNATCRDAAGPLFNPYLTSADEQTQLEAVIALGEAATDEAIELLCAILADAATPYFLRSAAAWSLSRTASPRASDHLVSIFSDVDLALRQEALDGLVAIGDAALPILLRGLRNADDAIAAGCAEALRRARSVPGQLIESLISELQTPRPRSWAIWLAGNLPREHFSTAIAQLQQQNPELHFALSVLWSFIESWIARNWELRPTPHFPEHPGR